MKNKQKMGSIIEPIHGLNYGQTVNIIDEAKYPKDSWIIQPHGEDVVMSVPKTAVYIPNSLDYYYINHEN